MCGIHVSISACGFQKPSHDLIQLLCNRGPDHLGEQQARIKNENGLEYCLSFTSTVLALRGGLVTTQPFIDVQSGSMLCWNGEAWRIGQESVVGNDGQAVFDSLIRASFAQKHLSESTAAILKVLRLISGPFAFVFFDMDHNQIYFGRDRLGRRSLLYNTDSGPMSMEFASVADPTNGCWKEVEADAVYQLSFSSRRALNGLRDSADTFLSTSMLSLSKHLWDTADTEDFMISLGKFNRLLPTQGHILNARAESVKDLRKQVSESLQLRVLNIPKPPGLEQDHNVRVAVLFSGGLDCTVLACMTHDLLPHDQHIDLINVAFENPRVVDAANKTSKLKKNGKDVQTVVEDQDSTNEFDVIHSSPYESCPDRQTGRKAFRELQNVCPNRVWRFVAVNVPYSETMAHRASVITVIHPHNTEMDLSIAYALYFAARGTGVASSNANSAENMYTTPARVLLSGLGADELFGGYTRHATAFSRTGFTGLLDELELDVNRLGKRNLGRDDRVISHWGREARFPYLDESLVKWAVECPIWEKCGFQSTVPEEQDIPEIEPGKKVLRLLAWELGMHSVAREKKRAIQFGARTAKMEIGSTKGTTLIS